MAVFVVDAVQYFLFCFIFYADGFSYFRMPFLVWDERYHNCDLNECAKTLNKKTTRQQTSFSITLHWWKFLGGRFIYYKMQWLIVPVLDQSDRSLAANLIAIRNKNCKFQYLKNPRQYSFIFTVQTLSFYSSQSLNALLMKFNALS